MALRIGVGVDRVEKLVAGGVRRDLFIGIDKSDAVRLGDLGQGVLQDVRIEPFWRGARSDEFCLDPVRGIYHQEGDILRMSQSGELT